MANATSSAGQSEKLRTPQLAKRWNVTTRCIQKWMGQGLPYFKVGAAVLFDSSEVEAWLQQYRRQQPAT